jgi:hypothetical protein
MFLAELPWLQMSGAIAGGLVGSFSGFIANSFHEQRVRHRVRRNLACALVGEIQTLTQYIEDNYLVLLRRSLEAAASAESQIPSHHYFRGDRDYMPIYRAIGATVGFLPTPLPRDLISWYTGLTTALERAHALHDLSNRADAQSVAYLLNLTRSQETALADLIAGSKPLITRLERL